jgi:hypothetical protein
MPPRPPPDDSPDAPNFQISPDHWTPTRKAVATIAAAIGLLAALALMRRR